MDAVKRKYGSKRGITTIHENEDTSSDVNSTADWDVDDSTDLNITEEAGGAASELQPALRVQVLETSRGDDYSAFL